MIAVEIASYVLVALTLPLCLYLGFLALLAWNFRKKEYSEPTKRFAIIVPSHNEQDNIADTVTSLKSLDYPDELRTVIVVADNCSDKTAELARTAGADVLERFDEVKRGKGYALDFAFDTVLEDGTFDAVVVVDADTVVSKNLLRSFEARLNDGEHAVQAEYGVSNVRASWRTKLMAIALGMFHRTRSLARERLKVSVGLRGNGMCFSTALIKEHPHRAFSVVEDVEYGITIGLAGKRVAFAEDAYVLGEMVSSAKASVSQRQRWEGGRFALAKQHVPPLLSGAMRRLSLLLFDLAIDLLVPPLSYVAILCFLGLGLETAQIALTGAIHPSAYLWAASLLGLLLYVLRGVQHSGLGLYGLVVLMYAPFYVVWKIAIARPFGRKGAQEWVRTKRENEGSQSREP